MVPIFLKSITAPEIFLHCFPSLVSRYRISFYNHEITFAVEGANHDAFPGELAEGPKNWQ